MSLQPNGPAPYSTASAVTTVLNAWRDRGFGVPVTPDTLTRVGVPESLARRTLQSLVSLDLLDDKSQPTEQFRAFRDTRGEDEYRTRLQEWLRGVYADVLQYADPATESYDRVTEAFRTYEPAGQRRGMASLLLGLWRYAGLPVAAAPEGSPRPSPRPPGRRPAPRLPGKPKSAAPESPRQSVDGLPGGLVGLLHQIPRNGDSWTNSRRKAFLAAFQAVLDFSVPVDDSPPPAGEEEDTS